MKGAPRLWHFTCDHHAPSIVAVGALVPRRHPFLPALAPVVWLTEDPDPERAAVGLTMRHIDCDRLAHRFMAISTEHCQRWADVRYHGSRSVVHDLERFARPETWWVATVPVPVVLA
jgi:hypothetical protein